LIKFLVDNWLLLMLALASGGLLVWPVVRRNAGGADAVSTSEAVRLINREKGVLIDVCEPAEFSAGHAIGARNVPLSQLDTAKGLPTNKNVPLLLMCASGARSSRAVAQLRKAGYEKAVAVSGGNAAWREAQLPMEKSA
jgi:rhodanese-related sulfurtransferase